METWKRVLIWVWGGSVIRKFTFLSACQLGRKCNKSLDILDFYLSPPRLLDRMGKNENLKLMAVSLHILPQKKCNFSEVAFLWGGVKVIELLAKCHLYNAPDNNLPKIPFQNFSPFSYSLKTSECNRSSLKFYETGCLHTGRYTEFLNLL